MKLTKTILATALLAGAGVAQAEVSANLGVASNYYFRGISQTDDKAAVSGGLDYANESGFYVGTWMSNIDFSSAPKTDLEIDGYAGFGGDIGDTGLGYDISGWYYWYPGAGGDTQGGELDYAEISGSLSFGPVTGTIAYTFWAEADDDNTQAFQEGDIYYNLSADLPFEFAGFTSSAFIGYYDFDDDGGGVGEDLSYYHWGLGIAKDAGDFGTFSLNYEQTDDQNDLVGDDNPNFWLGWAKDF